MMTSTPLPNLHDAIHHYPALIVAVRVTYISITAILSICCNTLCLAVLPLSGNSIPENNRLLMMSLSAADLGIGLISALSVPPVILGYWPYGGILCDIISALMNMCSGIAIFSLILISLDRYLAVTKPLRYPVLVTRKKTIIAILLLWVTELIACCALFPLLGAPIEYNSAVAKCTPLWRPGEDTAMLLISLTFTIILPFFLMIFIYSRLFVITRKQIKWMHDMNRSIGGHDRNGQVIATHNDRKATRIFCTITTIFGLSWLPYTVTFFYQNLTENLINETIQFLVVWAVALGSWMDVVTFGWMSSSFRRTAKKLLSKLKCRKRSDEVVPLHISVSERSRDTITTGDQKHR